MPRFLCKDSLVRLALFLACVLWCCLASFSARWLVGRDDIYLGLLNSGFGFISGSAEMLAFVGLFPTLVFGVVSGLFAAVMFPRD